MKLLNPGPVTLSERVRAALASPDLCHREPEFAALLGSVMTRLSGVYGEADYVPVVLSGSGTAAVEAMLASFAPKAGAKILVLANGVYGGRAAAMLRAQDKAFELVSAAWTEGMDLAGAERALSQGGFAYVFAVHHETTTGRLNDVEALGKLCLRHQVPLLLDAVSSFAGESIRFAEWNLAACAATANKCVHGVPGVSFVMARRALFDDTQSQSPSLYLDLFRYEKEQRRYYSPSTQAVHVLYALDEALAELHDEGGWRARHAKYATLANRLREGMQTLGFARLLPGDAPLACTLTAFSLPPTLSYEQLHDALKRDGYVIYAGQGALQQRMFRIANMGALDTADIDAVLASMRSLLAS